MMCVPIYIIIGQMPNLYVDYTNSGSTKWW